MDGKRIEVSDLALSVSALAFVEPFSVERITGDTDLRGPRDEWGNRRPPKMRRNVYYRTDRQTADGVPVYELRG